MSAKALIAINIFLGLLVLFTSSSSIVSSGTTGFLNVTADNQTEFIVTGSQSFGSFSGNLCELSGSSDSFIDLLQSFINLIPGINCITGFTTFVFSYQAIQTGIVWLGILIFGLVLADIWIVLKLIRGGG